MESTQELKSYFTDLPEELLVVVAKHLEVPHSRSVQANRYSDLLSLCLVNQKCGRGGQEVLFRNCDVSSGSEPYLLLRTLLEKPGLRPKLRGLGLSVRANGFRQADWVQNEHFTGFVHLTSIAFGRMLPNLLSAVNSQDLTTDGREIMNRALNAQHEIAWLTAITLLAPNLRLVGVRGSLHTFVVSFTGFLAAVLRECKGHRGLETLSIIMDHENTSPHIATHADPSYRPAIEFSRLKEFYLYAPELSAAMEENLRAAPEIIYECPVPQICSAQLVSLTLNGCYQIEGLRNLCERLVSLQSFVYEVKTMVSPSFADENIDEVQMHSIMYPTEDLWHAIRPLAQTLQYLCLHFGKQDWFRIWPQFLHTFTALEMF